MGFTVSRRQILCYLLFLAAGFLLASCAGGTVSAPEAAEQPGTLPTTSSSLDPAGLYGANCAGCHGKNRYGRISSGGPLTPESLAGRSDALVKEVISEGLPYTAMPAWKDRLSPDEISSLVQFIKYTSP